MRTVGQTPRSNSWAEPQLRSSGSIKAWRVSREIKELQAADPLLRGASISVASICRKSLSIGAINFRHGISVKCLHQKGQKENSEKLCRQLCSCLAWLLSAVAANRLYSPCEKRLSRQQYSQAQHSKQQMS